MSEPAKVDTAPSVKRGKTARIALILSLAANLLLVGLLSGAMLGGHWREARGMALDVGFGPLTPALTREDRKALREKFLQNAPDRRAERQAAAADYGALVTALRSDPFDLAGAQAALANQGERNRLRLEQGRALLVQRIETMSAAERQAFADRIEKALARRASSESPTDEGTGNAP